MQRLLSSPLTFVALALSLVAACSAPASPVSSVNSGTSGASALAAEESAPVATKPAKSEKRASAPESSAAALARVIELSKTDNRVMRHLEHLCKAIGPRLTGSTNFDRAADWCVGELRSWGLEAHLEKWGEFKVRFDRGPSHGRIVAPKVEELAFVSPAWTRGTDGPLRGAALLEPADAAGVEALAGKVGGAWIVRRRERPDGKVRRALEELVEREPAAGYVGSSRGDLLQMGGNHDLDLAKLPPQRRVTLRGDQYDALVARLETGEAVELEFDLQHKLTDGPVPCFNVVAEIPGREFPDEYVIVGGHLDSWDGAEGAQDNGTGSATTLEAARLIAKSGHRPRRTIRFVLFGGGEQGLYGSHGYVDEHKSELERISVALIHDGGGTVLRGLAPTYRMMEDFERVFAPLAKGGAAHDPRFEFELTELDGLMNSGDSDHAPFIAKGVPGFFWEQTEEGYEHVHHTQYDTFETVDAPQLERSAQVVAIAALGFAELDHLVDRVDMEPIPRRRMGVQLEGARITSVMEQGKAGDAGAKEGDLIVAIDGVEVGSQPEVITELQRGGPKKVLRLKRGEETVEVTLDYTGAAGEDKRAARAAKKEEWLRARGARKSR